MLSDLNHRSESRALGAILVIAVVNLFVGMAREVRLNPFYVEVTDFQRGSYRDGVVVSQGHIVAGMSVDGQLTTFDFLPYQAKAYRDFRELLEHKPMDAVIIGTPDHWHAIQTVMACQAGFDVYVEKPLSLTIREGRLMVEAARKYNRVVQTGSQQRSGRHYREAVELIQSGGIGAVHHVEAGLERNSMPGFKNEAKTPPTLPANFDWDMFLGPAPKVDYDPMRSIYHFRWFWDYSGGQMTNWGAHNIDIGRWGLDVEAPISVSAFGGRYAVDDGGQTPDIQEVIYKLPNAVLTWAVRVATSWTTARTISPGSSSSCSQLGSW